MTHSPWAVPNDSLRTNSTVNRIGYPPGFGNVSFRLRIETVLSDVIVLDKYVKINLPSLLCSVTILYTASILHS